MQQRNVLFQVILGLLQNPLLEVNEVERVRVVDVLGPQPVDEVGEIVGYFPPDEYPIYHVAAEQPHFYFVPQVQVNFFVLMNTLKDM